MSSPNSTASRFCDYCRNIPWPKTRFLEYYLGLDRDEFSHYKTLALLRQSADSGCRLCQLFWAYIINCFQGLEPPAETLLEFSISYRNDKFQRINIFLENTLDTESIDVPFRRPDFGSALDLGEALRIKQFTPSSLSDDLSDLIQAEIRPWMTECCFGRGDHRHCKQTNVGELIPTRLVDVGKPQSGTVKLVETDNRLGSTMYPYLILSYCWGEGNDIAKTTGDNLQNRRDGFAMAGLPKTIRDAIILTRMMEYQYLWVDAICIIQSSGDGDPGDFEKESVNMGDYYANARCCISAALASNSSEGFLNERPLGRYPIQGVVVAAPKPPLLETRSFWLDPPSLDDHPDTSLMEALEKSPLMKRAWCFQEWLLSPRILHWTAKGLFRECRSLHGILEISQKRKSSTYPSGVRDILERPDIDTLGSGWSKLVSRFSCMDLTYPKDRLYAIHGIAQRLSRKYSDEYCNGVFRSHLMQGLIWHSHPEFPRRTWNECRFPTWCWASRGPVEFDYRSHRGSSLIHDIHPRRFPTDCGKTTSIEPFDTRLHIKAPLINLTLVTSGAQLSYGIEGYIQDGDIDLQGRPCRYILDDQPEQDESYSWIGQETPDSVDFGYVLEVSVLLISEVEETGSMADTEYIGILLEGVNDEEARIYKRYGLINIFSKDHVASNDLDVMLQAVVLV